MPYGLEDFPKWLKGNFGTVRFNGCDLSSSQELAKLVFDVNNLQIRQLVLRGCGIGVSDPAILKAMVFATNIDISDNPMSACQFRGLELFFENRSSPAVVVHDGLDSSDCME